ncbi:MAG: prepilin-type N-terminal cleavage/methylation domain-containing protein [Nitrospinae bacterium]|nr:prepilin-type N-terminal cleavage/methylation domain-containing protein [Nitrospinota bacterium]
MKNLYKQSGFTMVEMLMAMVILSIALIGLAKISTSVIRTNSFSESYTIATALAQDKLEEIMNLNFFNGALDDLTAANNSAAGLLSVAAADVQETQVDENGVAGAGGIFTRSINIWDRTDIENPATRKDIAVIVSWLDALGKTRKVTVSTIKSRD